MVYAFKTVNGQWSKLRFTSEVDFLRHAKHMRNAIGQEPKETSTGFVWATPTARATIEKVDVKLYLNA